MAKVWLVSTGAYSDFGIVAAFTTEALAQEHATALNADNGWADADVLEYRLNDTAPQRHGYYWATVHAGDRPDCYGFLTGWDYDKYENQPHGGTTVSTAFGLGRGATQEQALKIACDNLALRLAIIHGLT